MRIPGNRGLRRDQNQEGHPDREISKGWFAEYFKIQNRVMMDSRKLRRIPELQAQAVDRYPSIKNMRGRLRDSLRFLNRKSLSP